MRKIGIVFICIFFQHVLRAQDSLRIYDLIVNISSSTSLSPPSRQSGAVTPNVPDSVNLSAVFKVNDPGSISQIFISIGASQDGSEVKSDVINVVNENGIYHMRSGNTEICRFWGLSTNYSVSIRKTNLAQANWFTIYAKDNAGNYTARKYFKIH